MIYWLLLRGFPHVPCRTFFWLMNVRIFSLPYSLLLDYSHLGSLPYPTLPEIEKPLPFRAWLPHLKLLILASTAQIVRSASSCQNSGHIPNVRVADSQHLLVNWENALEGCDSSKVLLWGLVRFRLESSLMTKRQNLMQTLAWSILAYEGIGVTVAKIEYLPLLRTFAKTASGQDLCQEEQIIPVG